MNEKFVKDYLSLYTKSIFKQNIEKEIVDVANLLKDISSKNKKVIIAGNGGSAALASHVTVDLTKQAKVRTINFNEYDLITCFANDYGYENWISRALEAYMNKGDLVILISSSGSSKNIINAANHTKNAGNILVTFSGFSESNQLNGLGDYNFWVDSKAYNVIENTHLIWLLSICDTIIGKAEYPA